MTAPTEASNWLAICRRMGAQGQLVRNQFARRMLDQAAVDVSTTGFCGRMYLFSDGSTLLINDEVEVCS
jgi:hypothetical protein